MISKPIRFLILRLCRSRHDLELVCRERRRYLIEMAAYGKINHKPSRAAAKSLRLAMAIAIVQIDITSPNALAGAVALFVTSAVISIANSWVYGLGH